MLASTVGRRSANTEGRERGLVLFDLLQMPDHVAKRDEPVLDVVIDLAGQVADGGASFGIAHAGRACSQAGREVAQKTGKRSDFVGTSAEAHVETIEIEHGRLRGKVGERFADPRRQPHAQQKRGDSSAHGGPQKPGIHAAL